ncbi:MAG TPA: tRNA (adenosine(37)-N6)-threonylcarbamoyltransferase complex dimerization subunit type 1 TsaB [Stellaceae bacterium]|nr:tRNA (adenosine(37)-N6)-threonylcarbamoyltransferase complex dimerization subunit type 1 TsaB [Stellaceae bacterium]
MNVLGFDCAGSGCSAAVLRDDKIAARRQKVMARGQAEFLMPMIADVLAEADLPVERLDLIGVTIGPGGFTGLRIGIAAARGLALAGGLPAVGITSFAAVAASVDTEMQADRSLIVALESKRAELYLQVFGADGAARGEGALVAPGDVADWLPDGGLLLAGDGAARLAAAIADRHPAMAPGLGIPDAADIAKLAVVAWRSGKRPAPLRPLYLREPDATVPQSRPQRSERRPSGATTQ